MPLNVVIAGASGFLGTHLSEELVRRGHAVVALVRRPTSAPDESTWDPYAGVYDRDVVEAADVVVNLAGAPTAGNPHSGKWAREAAREPGDDHPGAGARDRRASGPDLPRRQRHLLVRRPRAEVLTEESGPGTGRLLTEVTHEWQDATTPAADAGARVCVLRTAR